MSYAQEAYAMGEDAAKAAASWIVDGNSDRKEARRVLQMMRDGDPVSEDYMPRRPNLSGEWFDDMTPTRLVEAVTDKGPESVPDDVWEAICDAWEEAVSDHFESACEAELIRFTS